MSNSFQILIILHDLEWIQTYLASFIHLASHIFQNIVKLTISWILHNSMATNQL